MWKTCGIPSEETANKAPIWDNPRSLFRFDADAVDKPNGIIFIIHKVMNILEICRKDIRITCLPGMCNQNVIPIW